MYSQKETYSSIKYEIPPYNTVCKHMEENSVWPGLTQTERRRLLTLCLEYVRCSRKHIYYEIGLMRTAYSIWVIWDTDTVLSLETDKICSHSNVTPSVLCKEKACRKEHRKRAQVQRRHVWHCLISMSRNKTDNLLKNKASKSWLKQSSKSRISKSYRMNDINKLHMPETIWKLTLDENDTYHYSWVMTGEKREEGVKPF